MTSASPSLPPGELVTVPCSLGRAAHTDITLPHGALGPSRTSRAQLLSSDELSDEVINAVVSLPCANIREQIGQVCLSPECWR